jgi:hypothetical protein
MPSPTEILAGLALIANHSVAIAIAWHLVIAAALVALAAGWRPSSRLGMRLCSLPVASAAIVAIVYRNPFNGIVLGFSSIALWFMATRDRGPIHGGPLWTRVIGTSAIAFGAFYPHFLEGSVARYVYAAPVGLIPCPTLALTTGFALLAGGFGSRRWSLVLAAIGSFFGIFGILRLGVALDIGLVAAAGALAAVASRIQSQSQTSIERRAA